MGTETLNNRLSSWTPELIAQLNASITAAVREVADQFLAALKEHPEELIETRKQYFGE